MRDQDCGSRRFFIDDAFSRATIAPSIEKGQT
jgi:hypothetical protein